MTQIIITLAAVVLLILVIGFFAMRYLRAEGHDDFDDLPEERTTRSRGGDAADHDWRGDSGDPSGTRRARRPTAAGAAASRAAGGSSGPDGRDRSGSGRPQPGRGAPAAGKTGSPAWRPARLRGRPGTLTTGDLTTRALTPAGSTTAGSATGASTDRVQADRDPAAARRPTSAAATAHAPPGGGQRAVRPCQGREVGQDWDSMSDIDYWTELASDKPLTTTAQPAGQYLPLARSPRPARKSPPPCCRGGTRRPARRSPPCCPERPARAAVPRMAPGRRPVRPQRAVAAPAPRPGPAAALTGTSRPPPVPPPATRSPRPTRTAAAAAAAAVRGTVRMRASPPLPASATPRAAARSPVS